MNLSSLSLKNKIEVFEAIVGNELKDDEIKNILSISSLDTLYNKVPCK